MKLRIKYFDKNMTKLKKIEGGDLIDLRVSPGQPAPHGENQRRTSSNFKELIKGVPVMAQRVKNLT